MYPKTLLGLELLDWWAGRPGSALFPRPTLRRRLDFRGDSADPA
jgi:hypothetical protein